MSYSDSSSSSSKSISDDETFQPGMRGNWKKDSKKPLPPKVGDSHQISPETSQASGGAAIFSDHPPADQMMVQKGIEEILDIIKATEKIKKLPAIRKVAIGMKERISSIVNDIDFYKDKILTLKKEADDLERYNAEQERRVDETFNGKDNKDVTDEELTDKELCRILSDHKQMKALQESVQRLTNEKGELESTIVGMRAKIASSDELASHLTSQNAKLMEWRIKFEDAQQKNVYANNTHLELARITKAGVAQILSEIEEIGDDCTSQIKDFTFQINNSRQIEKSTFEALRLKEISYDELLLNYKKRVREFDELADSLEHVHEAIKKCRGQGTQGT